MNKFWKKAGAVFSAAVLGIAGLGGAKLTASAAVDTDSLSDGTAYLSINNTDWADFEAEYVTAEITGDGQYTVSMTASEPQNLVQFNALEVKNGEAALGSGSILTIDEIKINGKAVELQGKSYTCSADGAGITTRVNLYNEWNSPVDADGKTGEDFRSESDPADCTAMLWASDLNTGVKSVEVTFTVSHYGEVKAAAGEEAYVPSENAGTASLSINDADWSGAFTSEEIKITENGTYTLKAIASEPKNLAGFNALQIVEGEKFLGNATLIIIDEIKINGEVVEMQADNYTCSADGAGVDTRVNLYNEWNNPVDDAGNVGSDVRAVGDPAETSARLWGEDYQTAGVDSVEVKFTIQGVGDFRNEEAAEVDLPVADVNGTYHAYIGFQSPKYSFRNEWADSSYGAGVENGKYFGQVTGWDDANNAITLPGTFDDVEITGNGTYTVAAHGLDFTTDDWSQEYMNLIFFSTDIPNDENIVVSDVQLKVNDANVTLASAGTVRPEVVKDGALYLSVQLQNNWNPDIKEIGYYATPVTDIEITFTIAGFAKDAEVAPAKEDTTETAQAEPAAETAEVTAPAESGSSVNPVLICGLVLALVAIGIGCYVLVSKKKKS